MDHISAVIITYNEEENIGRCIESLRKVADEVIVLDAFSTDRTVEISKSKGATVKQANFAGYIRQKNAVITYAKHNYILSLDADEALSPELIESILVEKRKFAADAYSMNRCTSYCGKFIRNGTWYPDRKLRLFNKKVASWGGMDPHDKIELRGDDASVTHLKGEILHYSFPSLAAQLEKNDKYSTISAAALFSRGKTSNWFRMTVHPFWTFVHGYLIRLGFLDGFAGFVIAINSAHATFLKYIKLYELQKAQTLKKAKVPTTTLIVKQPVTEAI